jgi:mannose-6-phosphate isomerase-like protein (cupin superfamily)
MSEFVERPWGGYRELVRGEGFAVKELVFENGFIRNQRHEHRNEHWYILSGHIFGLVTETPIVKTAGECISIPRQSWHWLGGKARVIEVWRGTELSEDDIEVDDE